MDLTPAEFAEQVKNALERRVASSRQPLAHAQSIASFSFERISAEASGDDFDLTIVFRHSSRPTCLFGWKLRRIWAEAINDETDSGGTFPNEEQVEACVTLALTNLQEEAEAVDLGLPYECDPDSITWI